MPDRAAPARSTRGCHWSRSASIVVCQARRHHSRAPGGRATARARRLRFPAHRRERTLWAALRLRRCSAGLPEAISAVAPLCYSTSGRKVPAPGGSEIRRETPSPEERWCQRAFAAVRVRTVPRLRSQPFHEGSLCPHRHPKQARRTHRPDTGYCPGGRAGGDGESDGPIVESPRQTPRNRDVMKGRSREEPGGTAFPGMNARLDLAF
jgi:hypothetical protein